MCCLGCHLDAVWYHGRNLILRAGTALMPLRVIDCHYRTDNELLLDPWPLGAVYWLSSLLLWLGSNEVTSWFTFDFPSERKDAREQNETMTHSDVFIQWVRWENGYDGSHIGRRVWRARTHVRRRCLHRVVWTFLNDSKVSYDHRLTVHGFVGDDINIRL